MSTSLARLDNLEGPPPHEKTWLWIMLYQNPGTSHNDTTQHHWAYVTGTKTNILQHKGARFNIWKCQRLELDPESKLQHQDQIFEAEDSPSSHGGCYTQAPYSSFQLAEIKDENAFRRHLLTYAIPDNGDARGRTCHDWVKAIFEDLKSDHALSLCQSTRSNKKINDFAEVEARCANPGIHCYDGTPDHSSSWRVTEQGIRTRERSGSTQVETEHARREAPRSPRAELMEGLRRQLSRG